MIRIAITPAAFEANVWFSAQRGRPPLGAARPGRELQRRDLAGGETVKALGYPCPGVKWAVSGCEKPKQTSGPDE